MTAIVPNGLLALSGALPMHHQPRLVNIATISFLTTAIVAGLVAYFFVNDKKHWPIPSSKLSLAARAALPVGVIAALLAFYYGQIPDRKIPPHIDWALIESAYGEDLDAVEALTQIDDPAQWQSEVIRLDRLIESDSSIVVLMTSDETFERFQDGRQLMLGSQKLEGSCSSTGDGMWHNDQMMRCTRRGASTGRIDTLLYRRITNLNGNQTYIDVEFDYDELVERFDEAAVQRVTTGSEQLAQQHDQALLGTWSIDERYERTINEERYQTGKLHIGPRLSFGTYAIHADVEVESKLRSEKSRFERQACRDLRESCKFEEEAVGTLHIRGSKVQIIYENTKWGTDILRLSPESMVGRNNSWGSITRLKRDEGVQQHDSE